MTWFALCDADGELVAVGSVLPDPMPAGHNAYTISTEQEAIRSAGGIWNAATCEFDPCPESPITLYEQLLRDEPAKADAVIALALNLVEHAAEIDVARAGVSEANTARSFAIAVADQVVAAAAPLD